MKLKRQKVMLDLGKEVLNKEKVQRQIKNKEEQSVLQEIDMVDNSNVLPFQDLIWRYNLSKYKKQEEI